MDHDHHNHGAGEHDHNAMMMMEHKHDHHGGSGDAGDGMGCSMQMIFHGGNCEYILFNSWMVTEAASFIGVCLLIFVAAIAYEGLKYLREKLYFDAQKGEQMQLDKEGSSQNLRVDTRPIRQQILNRQHFIQTLLHLIQVAMSYILMLIVMTYNVWLFVAVVLGASFGYFFFGWVRNRAVDITEHCH